MGELKRGETKRGKAKRGDLPTAAGRWRGWAPGRALLLLAIASVCSLPESALAEQDGQSRARDFGIPFDGQPGPLNAITDVDGVTVGHTTLVRGSGPLVVGEGPVRTGVTAVWPRGASSSDPVFAAWFPLNGNGEMTGTTWVDESGLLTSPVMITNTHSVGVVRDAVVDFLVQRPGASAWLLPVVAETWDGVLNDLNGFHVRPEHAWSALERAAGGPVEEGAVGGGTGMICHGFKGGIGTSSRVVEVAGAHYTVGVLVQCNYGRQDELLVAGIPVGRELAERGIDGLCRAGAAQTREWLRGLSACGEIPHPDAGERAGDAGGAGDAGATSPGGSRTGSARAAPESVDGRGLGSIIIVVATDAPVLPHQLERIIKRSALGISRAGSVAHNGSGDIFLAFSTGNSGLAEGTDPVALEMLPNDRLNPLFVATVQATHEAVMNALAAAESMTGADDVRVLRLPREEVREILRAHDRLEEAP